MHYVATHMAAHHMGCTPTASCEGAAAAAALELKPEVLRADADALRDAAAGVAATAVMLASERASASASASGVSSLGNGGGSFALDGDAFPDIAAAFAASAELAQDSLEAALVEALRERAEMAAYLSEPEASLDGALEALSSTLGAFVAALDENEKFEEAARAVSRCAAPHWHFV